MTYSSKAQITHKIRTQCTGTSNYPTIVFNIGGGHWMGDGYPLQYFLNQRGFRVCLWDRPGMAYSSPLTVNEWDGFDPKLLNALLIELQEPLPIYLAGWAGEGPTAAYKYLLPLTL